MACLDATYECHECPLKKIAKIEVRLVKSTQPYRSDRTNYLKPPVDELSFVLKPFASDRGYPFEYGERGQ
jgi:hypothetical protein